MKLKETDLQTTNAQASILTTHNSANPKTYRLISATEWTSL